MKAKLYNNYACSCWWLNHMYILLNATDYRSSMEFARGYLTRVNNVTGAFLMWVLFCYICWCIRYFVGRHSCQWICKEQDCSYVQFMLTIIVVSVCSLFYGFVLLCSLHPSIFHWKHCCIDSILSTLASIQYMSTVICLSSIVCVYYTSVSLPHQ